MKASFNPLDYPSCLMQPTWLAPSHWAQHVPFAFSLVEMLRPSCVVELGVFAGTSYCAMCQAIDRLNLFCRAFGVDTWTGDPHNGENGPEILTELKVHHDPRYGQFSRLVPSTFDKAAPHFGDGSIDLLHIDGYHVYDAVRHDFDTWLPKMSARGVIIFHDINVREYDFGVWKLWQELKDRYPSFEFIHQHGLGVLAVGQEIPAALQTLTALNPDEAARVRDFYYQLGARLTPHLETEKRAQMLQVSARRLEELETSLSRAYVEKDTYLNRVFAEKEAFFTNRIAELTARNAESQQWQQVYRLQVEERDKLVEKLRIDNYETAVELNAIKCSIGFKIAHRMSMMARALLPGFIKSILRTGRRNVGKMLRKGKRAVGRLGAPLAFRTR